MLNRGLESAWLMTRDGVTVATFSIRAATTAGRKRIDFKAGPKAPRRRSITIADNLSYEDAIGCVNKILDIYESGIDRPLRGGVYDNHSKVKGTNFA